MKFYSEKLKCLFDTEEELNQAELAEQTKQTEKQKILAEIENEFDCICTSMNTIMDKIEKIADDLTQKEEIQLFQSLIRKMPKFVYSLDYLI